MRRCWRPIFLLLLICAASRAYAQHPGDRHIDPVEHCPEIFLIQNGGPYLDIKNPPLPTMQAAKGDGVTDDTEAFRDAYDYIKAIFQKNDPTNVYIYIPNGTYLVSDTLIYHGPTIGAYPAWNGKFDIDRIRIVGESRGKTILRLKDNAPGYADPANPKIVLAFQHPDTVFNNFPGGNWLRNLTIDTGRGNPGAAALFLQGANQTDLRNVTIRSEDGAGRYGIWFKTGSIQGYYTDVTVDGFDVGIFAPVNGESDPAFENLTLARQHLVGILQTAGGLSLRNVYSFQNVAGVPAFRLAESGGQTVIVDSVFQGSGGSAAIELARGAGESLFCRHIATIGYRAGIVVAGAATSSGPRIGEYVYPKAFSLRPGQTLKSLDLPIQATPLEPASDPRRDWAIVDEYPSVQAAFDSGRSVVVFRERRCQLGGNIRVPASVRVIDGMASRIEGGQFLVAEPSANPLFVKESGVPIEIEANRATVEQRSGGQIYNKRGLPVTLYLENVNDVTTGDDFCRTGQRVYARQIDIEYGSGDQIVCNGGVLWIFGYKTENMGATPFTVKNGGSLEILGGYANTTNQQPQGKQHPEINVVDANVSATLFTNLGSPSTNVVEETRQGTQSVLTSDQVPLRGGQFNRDISLPLYVSYGADAPR